MLPLPWLGRADATSKARRQQHEFPDDDFVCDNFVLRLPPHDAAQAALLSCVVVGDVTWVGPATHREPTHNKLRPSSEHKITKQRNGRKQDIGMKKVAKQRKLS
jgi:hypothetical protein